MGRYPGNIQCSLRGHDHAERRLHIQLDDEELMTIELVNLADLLNVVERLSLPPEQ